MRCRPSHQESLPTAAKPLLLSSWKVSPLPELSESSGFFVFCPFFATFTATAGSHDDKTGTVGRGSISGDLAGQPCNMTSLTATWWGAGGKAGGEWLPLFIPAFSCSETGILVFLAGPSAANSANLPQMRALKGKVLLRLNLGSPRGLCLWSHLGWSREGNGTGCKYSAKHSLKTLNYPHKLRPFHTAAN